MSVPRPIYPGTTYLLTRRCFDRRLLLRPGHKVNQIFKFCMAHAARRTGVLLHASGVLSNHYHIVATDPRGALPEFMHWLNEYVAKCINAEYGRWESFWAPGSYSSVALHGREDVLGKLVYVYTNPVDAGLVRRHYQWPGVLSMPADLGAEPETVDRPVGFFRDGGPVPRNAPLAYVLPAALDHDAPRAVPLLQALVREREEEIHHRRRQNGLGFLGRRRVMAQSPFARPASPEPRRGLDPRLACRDKWRRIEALRRLETFLHEYRDAWTRFRNGEPSVVFPFGTYAMRVRFGVQCAGP